MFSSDTENLLICLFYKIAEDEISVEATRLNLADMRDFVPFDIFKYLDHENKNYIDEYSLLGFLK
jgi:hypothetical protein